MIMTLTNFCSLSWLHAFVDALQTAIFANVFPLEKISQYMGSVRLFLNGCLTQCFSVSLVHTGGHKHHPGAGESSYHGTDAEGEEGTASELDT